jgi:hypothetical protein
MNSESHIHISAPFLAGYRTQQGRVRFEGAMGFAFNLRLWQFDRYQVTYLTGTYNGYDGQDLHLTFRPSFSAIVRAGISVPINDRATFDVLPTFRYSFLNFESGSFDALQSADFDLQRWSVGIDFGLTWKLDDKPVESFDKTETKVDDIAYTVNYSDTIATENQRVKKPSTGPKNFLYGELGGSGLAITHNYERTVFRKDIVSIQARAGFGMIPNSLMFPIGVNVALGKGMKKFEMGIGATIENLTDDNYDHETYKVNLVPSMALRVEKQHFFLKLSLMSHYFFESGELMPGIGVSLGGCF